MSLPASGRPVAVPAWGPSASLQTLAERSALYRSVRSFFDARGVVEVDTPILSRHGTVDPHIDSIAAADDRWLQTSPEFAMKRLVCAGSGPIFQIAPAFRAGETGQHHNPEFRMLEWYRPLWDYRRLMDETEALVRQLLGCEGPRFERISYREAFERFAGFDPFSEKVSAIANRALALGVPGLGDGQEEGDRCAWLDQWLSFRVGPQLGLESPVFIHDFLPAQAALARVRSHPEPAVAERFELFFKGLELANGYQELTEADELEKRFEADRNQRLASGKKAPEFDRNLVAAQRAGMPDCSGVALGIDRLLMLKLGLPDLASTMSFNDVRA